MELILDFLDGSASKTFLIPLKSTPFIALRIIYFKLGLDIHADDLTELALALSPQNFIWKNILWLEPTRIVQHITHNGLKHVLLLKKHFLLNKDIQIAKCHSLLSSLLYYQFYKIFISSNNIGNNILISLSARLLQSEFYGCEITLQSLFLNTRLSSILPAVYREDSSLAVKIFDCWKFFDKLCERESQFEFITAFLSHPDLYCYYSYDVFKDRDAVLFILTDELKFIILSHSDVEVVYPTSSICSLSISLEKHSISICFANGIVTFFSDYAEQIASILAILNLPIVCLDDFDTDIDQTHLLLKNVWVPNLESPLTDYLKLIDTDIPFFECYSCNSRQETKPLCPFKVIESFDNFQELSSDIELNIPHTTSSGRLFSSNIYIPSETTKSESSNLCELHDYDTNYDILEVPQGICLNVLQDPEFHSQKTSSFEILENSSIINEKSINFDQYGLDLSKFSDEIDENDYTINDEQSNPIYSDLYGIYPCPSSEFLINFSSTDSCYSASNKSTISPFSNRSILDFNELGETYNSMQEIGLKCTSDYFQIHSISPNSIVGRSYSDTQFQRVDKGYGLHIYSDFLTSSKYFFVSYVLLPNYSIYTELVDIRDKAQNLLINLGFPIGFWNDFFVYILGCPFVFTSNPKQNVIFNSFNMRNPTSGSQQLRKYLDLEASFISQNIDGSMIFQIVRKCDALPEKTDFSPLYNSNQHYFRCCFSIIHCNTPITLQQAIDFASLQYKGYFFHRVSNTKSEYCSPWHFISDDYKSIRGISKQIHQEQENVQLFNFPMVRDALIHKYMNLPQSGYIFFNVKEVRRKVLLHPKLVPIHFGISSSGLMTVHPISKRILTSYDFHALKSWKFTNTAFMYKIGTDKNVTAIQTDQGLCISTIISYFINGILETTVSEEKKLSKLSSSKRNSDNNIFTLVSPSCTEHKEFPNEINNVYESI